MLTGAFRQTYQQGVLVAGDSDFTPLVDALVQMGVDVTVCADKSSLAADLGRAADLVSFLTFPDYWNASSESFTKGKVFPKHHSLGLPSSARSLGNDGSTGEQTVQRHTDGTTIFYSLLTAPGRPREGVWGCSDQKVLESYFELTFGTITWPA